MKNAAFYNYGITDISINEKNEELLNINYGRGKNPLSIFKRDIMAFIEAILPKDEREQREITAEKVNKALEEDGIKVLNYLLGGRSMIMITEFENYFEYCNVGQNHIKKITGLNINGEMELESAFDYEEKRPTYEDLYPPTPKKNGEER